MKEPTQGQCRICRGSKEIRGLKELHLILIDSKVNFNPGLLSTLKMHMERLKLKVMCKYPLKGKWAVGLQSYKPEGMLTVLSFVLHTTLICIIFGQVLTQICTLDISGSEDFYCEIVVRVLFTLKETSRLLHSAPITFQQHVNIKLAKQNRTISSHNDNWVSLLNYELPEIGFIFHKRAKAEHSIGGRLRMKKKKKKN